MKNIQITISNLLLHYVAKFEYDIQHSREIQINKTAIKNHYF